MRPVFGSHAFLQIVGHRGSILHSLMLTSLVFLSSLLSVKSACVFETSKIRTDNLVSDCFSHPTKQHKKNDAGSNVMCKREFPDFCCDWGIKIIAKFKYVEQI